MEEKEIKLKLTESEFNMIIHNLKWMGCIVRDNCCVLNYENYCNGECDDDCNRPDLCNFETWFKSKIIE